MILLKEKSNMENLYFLESATDIYLILTFRAQHITDATKIDIIKYLEEALNLKQTDSLEIHLIWNTGYANSDFTVWSEKHAEQKISHKNISAFFSKAQFKKISMPTSLEKKMNHSIEYIVFPDEQYANSMLNYK